MQIEALNEDLRVGLSCLRCSPLDKQTATIHGYACHIVKCHIIQDVSGLPVQANQLDKCMRLYRLLAEFMITATASTAAAVARVCNFEQRETQQPQGRKIMLTRRSHL